MGIVDLVEPPVQAVLGSFTRRHPEYEHALSDEDPKLVLVLVLALFVLATWEVYICVKVVHWGFATAWRFVACIFCCGCRSEHRTNAESTNGEAKNNGPLAAPTIAEPATAS